MPTLAALPPAVRNLGPPLHAILMTYWSDDTSRYADYPVPGSLSSRGAIQANPQLLRQLDDLDVMAYAFLKVDAGGELYFRRPDVDLSTSDVGDFCHEWPSACPHTTAALAGSFDAFARLQNQRGELQKIISVGGSASQSSLDNALAHPEAFVRSASALIHAFHLSGIDLDFEPDAFFSSGQGERYAQLIRQLRRALGPGAFISMEIPADRETLRSLDCPADTRCRANLAHIAADAYVSLMGYDFHGPRYPGGITGNDSNLYADPDEPLVPQFYHVSDNQAVEYLTFRRVAPSRILLGFPAFFVSYGGVHPLPERTGLYQSFDPSRTETFDLGLPGLGSDKLLPGLLRSGFTTHSLRVADELSAVYAYNPSLRRWISYDDAASVAAKASYVESRRLAGMMMWEMGEDVPPGSAQSLLDSAHRALFARLTR